MNGIGGRTIDEAQSRMTYAEFVRWTLYIRKRGSLNLGTRIETATGVLGALYANAHSKQKYTRYDFMDHDDGPPIGLEQAMESWK